MVQREIAERLRAAPGAAPTAPLASLSSSAAEVQLAADGRPRGLHAAPAGRLGGDCGCGGAGRRPSRRSRGLVRDAFAHRRKSLPRSLELAAPGQLEPCPCGPGASSGCPRTRGPSAFPGGVRRLAAKLSAEAASDCDLTPRSREAQPLPLPRPGSRPTGCTRSVSLFEPLSLADLIEVTARPSATRSICPGLEGENLAADGAGGAADRGLVRGRRCGSRSRSGSRSPPGSAVAAPTRPRCCGWPGARSTTSSEIAIGLGADVPSQLEPGVLRSSAGAGEGVERASRPRAALAGAAAGAAAASRPPRCSPRPTGSGSGATPSELEGLRAAAARRCRRRGVAARLLRPAHQRPRARRGRCIPGSAEALEALRGAGAARSLVSGSGPTAFGLFADVESAREAAAAVGRDDAIVCEAGRADEACRRAGGASGSPSRWAIAGGDRGLLHRSAASFPTTTCRELLEDISQRTRASGPTCWSAPSRSWRLARSSASSFPARR